MPNEIGGAEQLVLFDISKLKREQKSVSEIIRLFEQKEYSKLDYIDCRILKRELIKT